MYNVLPKESPELKALRRLVFLKQYKDKHGKNEYYQIMQPKAWEEAVKVIEDNLIEYDFKIVQS